MTSCTLCAGPSGGPSIFQTEPQQEQPMGYPYRLEDVERTAEFVYRRMMASPLFQRWFALNEASLAAAAENQLAAGIAQLRTSSLLIASADLALTAGVPIAVWVGVFVAMGGPSAQARVLVRNQNFQSGFAQGFVTSILKWEWQHTVWRFGKFGPGQMNGFDESLSFIAANAHNEGLRSGYTHGHPRR